MRDGFSAAVGFFVAALFATLGLALLQPFLDYEILSILFAAVIYFPFAAVAVVVFGVPTFMFMRRYAPGTWWLALCIGAVLSVPLQVLLSFDRIFPGPLVFTPVAALSALVFWLVWRWLSEREGTCCAC